MSLFLKRLSANAALADETLAVLMPSDTDGYDKVLRESMRYSVLNGGKRLRAHLVMEFCALCGGKAEACLPYAAGIEMMHAFSLIHDDLPCMDNDTLRRGMPTNHVKYGESTALLAGDALSLYALETLANNTLCSDTQNLQAVKLLSAYAGCLGMCGGQQIDLQSENKQIAKDELETLVNKKTGALFAAACELGCIAAGNDANQRETARLFGLTTGLAFQIADDLLDLRASADKLGKTPGKDAESGKSTFVSLLGEAEAEAYASFLCQKAKELLDAFGDSDAKESLCAYCDFIITRDH